MGGLGTILGGIAQTRVSPAQTGLVVGAAAAAWSLRPSLLPRDEGTQAAVSVGSFALGFGVGAGLNATLAKTTRVVASGGPRATTLARLGILGVGAGIGVLALPKKLKEDMPFSNTVESAGRIALVAGLGSLGAQAHVYAVSKLATTPASRALVNAAFIGAELTALGIFLERRRRGFEKTDPTTPSAKTALVGGLAVAGSYLAVRGEVSIARRLAGKLTGTTSWKVHGPLLALGAAALIGTAAWKLTRGSEAKPLTVGHDHPGAVGPGADPKDEHATLGDASIRLLQGVQTAEEIERVTGRPGAVDPLRIAIGLESAPTPEARADLAVERMRASGAFDRGTVFVAVAPGAGMLDDRLPASVELLANGDVATVAIPYSDRASFLSLDRIPDGARTLTALLDGIERESAARRERGESAPRVVLYGNSLGAWSGQEAFRRAGVQGVLDRVDRVLWVGNPGPSGWRQEVLFPKGGQPVEGRDRVIEFSDVSELDELSAEDRERIGIWMHTRASDAVAKIDVDMLWRRPLYLQGEHRADARVPNNAAYVPGVSFMQELGDIITTSRIADNPDRQAEGHTYRVDIVPDVAAAFFPKIDDAALLGRVEAAVQQQEQQLGELRTRQREG